MAGSSSSSDYFSSRVSLWLRASLGMAVVEPFAADSSGQSSFVQPMQIFLRSSSVPSLFSFWGSRNSMNEVGRTYAFI
jgi:hypothetical protein